MSLERRITALLKKMTLPEKIGQMWQVCGVAEAHEGLIRSGAVGSFLNVQGGDAERYQRVALEESRLGIPLIFGRDVIHGFRTVMPIPLGQAASFNPGLVRAGARCAAREAASRGVHWTFAPMVDISRDARWGRIAESAGEDPVLAGRMGSAMVEGFQGKSLAAPGSIAACAKHYVGYGAAEAGREYNTTLIPEENLRDVYLPPFEACVKAGAATLMSAFNDLNGTPASGNAFTIRQVLKSEWGFDGFVVSDWASVQELIAHGYCAGPKDAAAAGITAGVDMEMVSRCYVEHAERLLKEHRLSMDLIDDAVRRILRIKFRLGLFDRGPAPTVSERVILSPAHLAVARELATQSCVLLKNNGALPLRRTIRRLAMIGPLADSGGDQLGCWAMDGVGHDTRTPLAALRELYGKRLRYAAGVESAKSSDTKGLRSAVAAARSADAVVLFLGEDGRMSGEAHARAFLDVPGAQEALLDAVKATGRPVITVLMTGRPLALAAIAEKSDALMIAWHPGTMGGPAIADLLSGKAAPSGCLPASFPRTVGQMPLYYARKNTGRPPQPGQRGAPLGTALDPKDFTATYIDVEPTPLFAFGFGLTYTTFVCAPARLSRASIRLGQSVTVSAQLRNTGRRAGTAVVQLYVRDRVGSLTRPIQELKDFRRVSLKPGRSSRVSFVLDTRDLAFHNARMERVTEPGEFEVWVALSSDQAAERAVLTVKG